MSNTNTLIARESAVLAKATQEFELKKTILEALPEGMEAYAINAFGYCADAMLIFKDATRLNEIAAALTPIPCTDVKGFDWTVKPTAYLRETDRGTRIAAAPFQIVYQKSSSRETPRNKPLENDVRWWSTVAGKTVEVHVEQVASTQQVTNLFDVERFEPRSHEYATGTSCHWVRRRKRYSDLKSLISYGNQWTDKWNAFVEAQGFDVRQKSWANALHSGLRFRESFQDALTRTRENPRMKDQCGPIESRLTPDQLAAIGACYTAQLETMDALASAQTVALETLKSWFLRFFADKGNPIEYIHGRQDNIDTELLQYLAAKETGLACKVNAVSREGQVDVLCAYDEQFSRFYAPYDVTAPRLDWDAYVEYFE